MTELIAKDHFVPPPPIKYEIVTLASGGGPERTKSRYYDAVPYKDFRDDTLALMSHAVRREDFLLGNYSRGILDSAIEVFPGRFIVGWRRRVYPNITFPNGNPHQQLTKELSGSRQPSHYTTILMKLFCKNNHTMFCDEAIVAWRMTDIKFSKDYSELMRRIWENPAFYEM